MYMHINTKNIVHTSNQPETFLRVLETHCVLEKPFTMQIKRCI